jgi:hypothetical protein
MSQSDLVVSAYEHKSGQAARQVEGKIITQRGSRGYYAITAKRGGL